MTLTPGTGPKRASRGASTRTSPAEGASGLVFPEGFIWGAATAAHQIEGGNTNNDWWAFEHAVRTPCVESSGDACDSWNRWEEDLDLVKGLGLGAYRFSIEWSRIEPAEGEYSYAALDHYRRMCAGCLERDIVPIVTFHHFTTPKWLADRGGWEAPDAPERFARYCTKAVAHLGDLIGWACTINEPNIVALMGYLVGVFPPGLRDASRRRAVNDALCNAHRLGAEAVRSGKGDFPVGMTLSMTDYQPVDGGEDRVARVRASMEDSFLQAAIGDDFLGVQTYTRLRISPTETLGAAKGVPITQMGYERWPDAVEACVRKAWADTGGTPLMVTEVGIGTADDEERIQYLSSCISGVARCISDGIDVRGVLAWSLLDNFEWTSGYKPTFGMVAVDRKTFDRTPKPSALWFGDLCQSNGRTIGASAPH